LSRTATEEPGSASQNVALEATSNSNFEVGLSLISGFGGRDEVAGSCKVTLSLAATKISGFPAPFFVQNLKLGIIQPTVNFLHEIIDSPTQTRSVITMILQRSQIGILITR
jgi:hypothetical protein